MKRTKKIQLIRINKKKIAHTVNHSGDEKNKRISIETIFQIRSGKANEMGTNLRREKKYSKLIQSV